MNFLIVFGVLILLALAVWALPQILAALKVPPNVATVIYVGLVVFAVLWLLRDFGMLPAGLR
jgi:hypothetical protein